ncbi:hypothetical protein E4U41_005424 [Claviceps citrina]|nr:hypothetical protein E4U41_005424 [Claviceps citrina]
MDYYVKKAVSSVKKRCRSRQQVEADVSIEKTRNCLINVNSTRAEPIPSQQDLARCKPSFSSSSVYMVGKAVR